MTRKVPSKSVDKEYGAGRLTIARAFRKAAQTEAELAGVDGVGNPTVSLVVQATIAYADALTARYSGRINQQDHSGATKALRDALGGRFPKEQERRLERIPGEKDAAQYGVRIKRLAEAVKLVADLEKFALWAELEFARTP